MELLRNDHMAKYGSCTDELTAHSNDCQGQGKAQAHSKTVKEGLGRTVLAGVGLGAAKDDAVYHDQRDIDSQGCVQGRNIALHQKLYDGNQAGHDHDEGRNTHPVRNDLSEEK